MQIRKVGLSDLEMLIDISRATFAETFSAENSEENMGDYLSNAFSKEKMEAELSDPNSAFYFIETGQILMGYLKINFGISQTEIKDENALEIERIYVLKDFQGKKAGQMLYDKAIEIARQHKLDYVWLGVWDRNQRAIRFYEKNGFRAFASHIFKLGTDEQTDIMMKLNLL